MKRNKENNLNYQEKKNPGDFIHVTKVDKDNNHLYYGTLQFGLLAGKKVTSTGKQNSYARIDYQKPVTAVLKNNKRIRASALLAILDAMAKETRDEEDKRFMFHYSLKNLHLQKRT